jgi:hypothetical protein
MARTLDDIIPTIYAGLNQVSRELIGFIGNVNIDAQAESGAVGQTVRSPVATPIVLEDIVPGNDPADSGDHDPDFVDVSITKSRAAPIRWNGEQQLSLTKDGVINTLMVDEFAEAFRALTNEVESDLAALYINAARAYGTAGTTPFGTADDHTDFAEMNRILDENGAPASGRMMVLGSAGRAKLEGKQPGLFRANEAGDGGAMLRNRELRRMHGFTMGYSAGIKTHTKGTATSLQTAAAESAGDTSIALDTGSGGTLLSGDVVTFAGDSNNYVVGTGFTAASGTAVLNKPGLRLDAADNTAMTIGNSYTANLAYHRNAMLLASRFPAMPEGGDSADDVTTIVDPVSGLTFQVALYRQYRRIKYEIGLAWGVAAPNSKWLGTLMG